MGSAADDASRRDPGVPGVQPALCVDLDGTLIATDILWESVVLLAKTRPWALLALPFWLVRGKAGFKAELARHVAIDATSLPYRPSVVEYLRAARKEGRRVVLATASDRVMVQGVVDHQGPFDEVLASDGRRNLSGAAKARVLIEHFGVGGFDYAGNAAADLAVWRSAREAIVVDASSAVLRRARQVSQVTQVVPRVARFLPAWKSLRAYQWTKNLLVFVPIAMAHRLTEWDQLSRVVLAFVVLSLCASGSYLLNDLMDLSADRAHPIKRNRPFAAGTLSIPLGVAMMTSLLVAGVAAAWLWLPARFTLLLVVYLVTTTAYSLVIKKRIIADIITLAGLYTLRILGGGFAAEVMISFWLLAFSMFIFLSLAFMKRYIELTLMVREGRAQSAGRAYVTDDLRILETMGTASSFISVAVLALFINDAGTSQLYRRPQLLWLVCPVLLYWLVRMWFRAQRGNLENDDPIVATFRDRVSYVVALLIGMLVVLAS